MSSWSLGVLSNPQYNSQPLEIEGIATQHLMGLL